MTDDDRVYEEDPHWEPTTLEPTIQVSAGQWPVVVFLCVFEVCLTAIILAWMLR